MVCLNGQLGLHQHVHLQQWGRHNDHRDNRPLGHQVNHQVNLQVHHLVGYLAHLEIWVEFGVWGRLRSHLDLHPVCLPSPPSNHRLWLPHPNSSNRRLYDHPWRISKRLNHPVGHLHPNCSRVLLRRRE